jgi:DNA repair protein RecN (Recombination protein N)
VLQEIRIQNLGVIDDAVLELHPGLNVITGETGAGKTMVVSGLGLLLGQRADSGLVRSGAERAVVEGVVDLPSDHPAMARAAEAGADVVDGLILVRSVSSEGRSRAHVGGRSAPVGLLGELAEQLVAVHGQADQWRLRSAEQHRALLDEYAGTEVAEPRLAYERVYDEHRAVSEELARLREEARDRAREVEVLRLGLEQVEAVDPQPGEDLDLRIEDERLSHAEELRTAAESAHRLLSGDEDVVGDQPSIVDSVAAARSALAGAAERDPELADLLRRLSEIGVLASELSADVAAYAAGVELDPARLGWVQQRRSDLGDLMRKYGDSADEVLAWAKEAAARLDLLLTADDRAGELEGERDRLTAELEQAAEALSAARAAAAEQLGSEVTAELGHLAMGDAVVGVHVSRRPDPEGLLVSGESVRHGRHGVDDVEIRLAAHPGSPARSVARAASGGELSRVMLALEVVVGARGSAVPTFVFDEVDAGVGGRAALDVGARLERLSRHAQVVVVTHLAQVAAFADRHHSVRKASDGHVTASDVIVLDDDARLRELARMMAGVDSDTSADHARELVDTAEAARRR